MIIEFYIRFFVDMYRNIIDIYSIEKLIIYLKKRLYVYTHTHTTTTHIYRCACARTHTYTLVHSLSRAYIHVHIHILIHLHLKYIWSCTQLYVCKMCAAKSYITKRTLKKKKETKVKVH